jgi:hypothetical protein
LIACLHSAKHPILFDRSRSTCPPRPRRERQAERASDEQRSSSEGEETILRGRLGGGSTQQAHLNTKGRGSATCDSSVRQQIPLGLRVSMRNPDERSCHLRRTRYEGGGGAHLTNTRASRVAMSLQNRLSQLLSCRSRAIKMRCRRCSAGRNVKTILDPRPFCWKSKAPSCNSILFEYEMSRGLLN